MAEGRRAAADHRHGDRHDAGPAARVRPPAGRHRPGGARLRAGVLAPAGAEGARRRGRGRRFPVFEVPYDLPFIAITEAVFTKLVAEQYDLLSRSLEAEHTLTRAVLDGQGLDGIVSSLDRGGRRLGDAARPARRGDRVDAHGGPELRAPHLGPSCSSSRPGGHPLQPVARRPRAEHRGPARVGPGPDRGVPGRRQEGRADASSTASSRATRSPCSRSSSRRSGPSSETERRLRGDVLEQILAGALGAVGGPPDARAARLRPGASARRDGARSGVAPTDGTRRRPARTRCRGAPRRSSARPATDHVLVVVAAGRRRGSCRASARRWRRGSRDR